MTASGPRAVCGVLALLLSGTPTALLVCAAWCLPGMGHGAALAPTTTASAPATAADPAAPGASVSAAAHAHHHAAAPEAPAQPLPATGGVARWAPEAGATAHECCPDAPTLSAATVTPSGARADARPVAWAIAPHPAPFGTMHATPVALLRLTAASRRLRPPTPLVLRV